MTKRTIVPWTDADVKQLEELYCARKTPKEIAEIMGRTWKSVSCQISLRRKELELDYMRRPPFESIKAKRNAEEKALLEKQTMLKRIALGVAA